MRDDVVGSQKVGMKGILVQTGKYRPNDELSVYPSTPDLICKNFAVAVRCIIGSILVRLKYTGTGVQNFELESTVKRKVTHQETLNTRDFLEKYEYLIL